MSKPFIEEDFISALNAVLRQFFPSHRLRVDRISSTDEKILGYDGQINYLKPIFIQFKRSAFFDTTYNGKYKKSRKALSIPSTSFYSFKLHRNGTAKTIQDIHLQHNVLFNLSQTEEAFYLAPLFHTKSELEDFNFSTHSNLPSRFYYDLHDDHYYSRRFIDNMIFSDTIGVKPHKIITDRANHCYTFDKTLKVAFHSEPESLENNGFDILRYFESLQVNNDQRYSGLKTFRQIEQIATERKINFWEQMNFLSEYHFGENLIKKNIEKEENEKLGILVEYFLKDTFDINQYVVIG